jgi:RHS repeat-associated protein
MTTAQHGYVMVDPNDKGAWQKLELEVPIEENGYIYIYVANESMDNVDVYFDDMEVQLIDAPLTSASDYYPFGLAMAGRSYSSEKYRFGYQGQFAEMDEETGWNAFEARSYDPVIGRWMRPDPAREFWSLYLAMGNDPVLFVDPDGETIKIGSYIYVPGQEYTGKNKFIAGTVKSLNRLYQAEQKLGKSIIGDLSKPGVILTILKSTGTNMGYRTDGTLGFNPHSGIYTLTGSLSDKNTTVTGGQSAEIGLIHELGHAYHDLIQNTYFDNLSDTSTEPDFANLEEKLSIDIENIYLNQINIMFDLNNMMRFNDYGKGVKTDSPSQVPGDPRRPPSD